MFRALALRQSKSTLLRWRRANTQNVSSIILHGVQHVPTSTFSWYNSLFYSLRRHRSTLVLTGTSILLFAFSLVFSDLVCFPCGAGEPKAYQVRFVFFYRWFSDNIELCLKNHSETKRKQTKTKTNKQTKEGKSRPRSDSILILETEISFILNASIL